MIASLILLSALSGAPLDGEGPKSPAVSGGIIEGTVVYRPDAKRRWRYSRYYIKDKKTGRLAEAVVALRGRSLRKPATGKPQTHNIDQKNFQFTPETIAIRVGDIVKFTNSDNATHNVRVSHTLANFNNSMAKGGEFSHPFDKAGGIRVPIRIGCSFHGAMRTWVFVFAHPHFALTGPNGEFRFANVPPGEYDLELRHPAGELRWKQRVRVALGKTRKVEIVVSPDHREDAK